jgi:hypothetical protein
MKQLSLPTWLTAMMDSRAGAAEGIRWFTPAECAASAQRRPTEFPDRSFWVSDEQRAAADQGREALIRMVTTPLLREMKAIETDAELRTEIDRQVAKRSKG